MKDLKDEELRNADWDIIHKKLVAYIDWRKNWHHPKLTSRPGRDNLGCGVTSKDIAQEIIIKVMTGKLKWNPSDPDKGDLFNTLKYHVRSALSNLVKQKKVTSEYLLIDDDNFDFTDQNVTQDQKYIHERWALLREAAKGDSELEELVDAMSRTFTNNPNAKAKDFADDLAVDSSEITNRRKRLKRRVQNTQDEQINTNKERNRQVRCNL